LRRLSCGARRLGNGCRTGQCKIGRRAHVDQKRSGHIPQCAIAPHIQVRITGMPGAPIDHGLDQSVEFKLITITGAADTTP